MAEGSICRAAQAAVLILALLNGAQAQIPRFAINIDDKVSKDGKKDVKDPVYGEGSREMFEVSFRVKVTNNTEAEASQVELRLIPFFITYDWNSKEEGHAPGQAQEIKGATLPVGEEKAFDFTSVKFNKQETFVKKTGTSWRSGQEYMGCAVELWKNGVIIATKFVGDSKVRRAYDAMGEKKLF